MNLFKAKNWFSSGADFHINNYITNLGLLSLWIVTVIIDILITFKET